VLRVAIYCASNGDDDPALVAGAESMVDALAARGALRFTDVVRIGDDLRLMARVERPPGPFSGS